MMYKTHTKIGQTLYILSIPVLSQAGIFPNIAEAVSTGDSSQIATTALTLGASALVGMHGAHWGSGYPDIDHPTSIPSRKSPIISKIFRAMNLKHRGPVTHSVDIVTVTFFMLLALVNLVGSMVTGLIDAAILNTFIDIARVWVISAYLGAISHLLADAMTKQGIKILFFLPYFRLSLSKLNTSILVTGILALVSLSAQLKEISIKSFINPETLLPMVIVFCTSFILYDVVNKKGATIIKRIAMIISLAALVYMYMSPLGLNKTITDLVTYMVASVFLTSILPGIDFFKTGDDSTWEQLVRKAFSILLPISLVVSPLLIILKIM